MRLSSRGVEMCRRRTMQLRRMYQIADKGMEKATYPNDLADARSSFLTRQMQQTSHTCLWRFRSRLELIDCKVL